MKSEELQPEENIDQDVEPDQAKSESSRPVAPIRPSRHSRRPHSRLWTAAKWVLIFFILEAAAVWLSQSRQADKPTPTPKPTATASPTPTGPHAGQFLGQDSLEHFTAEQAAALIKHNYPTGVPKTVGVTKIVFHYRSQLPTGEFVTVYGRAYLPDDPRKDLPTFAFAPGTTGIGDQCAPSLEKPAVANWANYDSHLSAYAAQGYAAVTTDYEGMRDPARLHHYMVGELEGRALLDAVRALRVMPQVKNRLAVQNVFLAGYSQGGHAAFWGDKIAASYAPDVKPLGVVGFGPVMSVKATLADIVRGANINWFGPNVVLSYQDYYKTALPGVILPAREATLANDVLAHCIDTDLPYWGHTPAAIYTPEFIQAAQAGTIDTAFPQFAELLNANTVGDVETPSAKRINEGVNDNVVLPSQQTAALPQLCASSKGPVQYLAYPNSTHYNTMLHSFVDTLAWMRSLTNRQTVPSTCN
jgi:hypothetical protein